MFVILQKITAQTEMDFEELGKIVEFLQTFADKCHHGKEEALLFPAMLEEGGNKEEIELLLKQHVIGRGFVKEMFNAVQVKSAEKFIENFKEYQKLLTAHIEFENTKTFPEADSILSEEKQKELEAQFMKVEKEVVGEGKHESYHAMIDELSAKYQ